MRVVYPLSLSLSSGCCSLYATCFFCRYAYSIVFLYPYAYILCTIFICCKHAQAFSLYNSLALRCRMFLFLFLLLCFTFFFGAFSLLFLNVVAAVVAAIIVIIFEARAIPNTSLLATFSSYFLFGQFFFLQRKIFV